MRPFLLYIFIINSVCLFAQSKEQGGSAIMLFEAGKAFLQKDTVTPFDQLQAFNNFQQCKQLLKARATPQNDLYQKNETQLASLELFFSKNSNRDSLLNLTRFFPDSIFQINATYSASFKLLVNSYLDLKRIASRNAYYKLKHLNYIDATAVKNKRTNIITFENYWPLEVHEFENWLSMIENKLQKYPKNARSALLLLHLQTKLNDLRNQENTNYFEQKKQTFQTRIANAEADAQIAKSHTKRLKNIGWASLALLLLTGYYLWNKNNKVLNKKNQLLLEEKKRSEDLLSNMLPAEVVRELKTKGVAKANKYASVSVLFSDFKNFSQIAETLSPEELVMELDHCFIVFDRIVEKYRLQKIKTIGDAYMCVGGLYTRGGNHVHRMVFAALEIQQFLADRKAKQSSSATYFFEARIGIHTGPVVAGVIGRKKIAFDIWGDTVNVAQQMEHHSQAGKVNVTGETYEQIKHIFDCEPRGKVIAKNKLEYEMYFVKGTKK